MIFNRAKKGLSPNAALLNASDEDTRRAIISCLKVAQNALENPEDAYAQGATLARQAFWEHAIQNRLQAAYKCRHPRDIPDDLAFGYLVNTMGDFRTSPKKLAQLAACLVWIARADAEDLYLPKKLLFHLNHRWTPERTDYLIHCDEQWYGKRGGNRLYRQYPGRNEPCICNSGKKFKTCCLPGLPVGLTTTNFNREPALAHLQRPPGTRLPLPKLDKLPLLDKAEFDCSPVENHSILQQAS